MWLWVQKYFFFLSANCLSALEIGSVEKSFSSFTEEMFSLQMPSAMVGNSAAQSAILDLGSGSQNDTMKQILGVVDKKVRNMEKKKVFAQTEEILFPSPSYVTFVF